MYEAKQCKEKVSRRIDGGGVRQKMKNGNKNRTATTSAPKTIFNTINFNEKNAIQRYFGGDKPSVFCEAYVHIRAKKNGKSRYINECFNGQGGSDFSSRGTVINKFTKFGLGNLANIQQAIDGNLPGQCSEPHAIADALNSLEEKKKEYSNYTIVQINVDSAIVTNPTQAMINHGYKIKDIMPRCTTCAQWVPGNQVLPLYLK